jgi:predicted permease
MQYVEALFKVLPVILLILTGIFLRKKQFIGLETVQDIKKLVVNITLPALLFLAFSRVNIEPPHLIIVVIVFAACLLALFLGRQVQPWSGIDTPQFPMLMSGFEAGMMGYAIFSAVYGAENVFKFGIIDLGQVLFVFFVLVPSLQALTDPQPFAHTVRNFIKTPVILAILGGILLSQSGLMARLSPSPFVASLTDTLTLISSVTTPLVALIIGYEMRLQKGDLAGPLRSIAIRMAFWVPFALLLSYGVIDRWLNLEKGFQAAVMTMFVLPPPFVIPIFMKESRQSEQAYVVNSLSLATLVTLFAFAIVGVIYTP